MVKSLFPIQISDMTVRRRGNFILRDITTVLRDVPVTLVLGPNGAGKSTFLKAVHGIERISSGHVSFAEDITIARRRQSFVFQTPIVLRRTVLENLKYPLQLRGTDKATTLKTSVDWAQKVGLGDLLEQNANRLSGGEKQKLALARALTTSPSIVFLDEPCANLDGQSTADIEEIILSATEQGTRFILATHNMGQAKRLGTDVLFFHKGNLLETSDATSFFKKPKTPQAKSFIDGDIVK